MRCFGPTFRRAWLVGTAAIIASAPVWVVHTAALAASAGTAGLSPDGCVNSAAGGGNLGVVACASTAEGLGQNVNALALSPNGEDLYVAPDTAALPFFSRALGGALRQVGCAEDVGSETSGLGTGDCGTAASTQTHGLSRVLGVVVSPDGTNVYALGTATVVSFARAKGGALRYLGCFEDRTLAEEEEGNGGKPTCGATNVTVGIPAAIAGSAGIAISPNGRDVYVAAGNDVATFRRGAGGRLAPAGCIAGTSQPKPAYTFCRASAPGLNIASDVVISPDGRDVYVAGEGSHTITVFRRSSSGALSPAGCVSDTTGSVHCALRVPGLSLGPLKLVMAHNGHTLYVLTSESVQAISRSGTGALSNDGCIASAVGTTSNVAGCSPGPQNLTALDAMAISPDGADLYIGSTTYEAVFVLSTGGRNPHVLGCIQNPSGESQGFPLQTPEVCAAGDQFSDLAGVESLDVAPGGAQLYVGEGYTASGYGALAIFDRRG